MKHCIIADFEWCVTPHPASERFQYYNEILSAGAVRIDEEGHILERYYTLIRPECAEYLHPVILKALRLDRDALSAAPSFDAFWSVFRAFAGDTPIFTWGCADRSAVLQNLRIKAGYQAEDAAKILPPMRDLQPVLAKGAGLHPPYPSLAAVLALLRLGSENRHNAISDAEDTAHIVAYLAKTASDSIAPLFSADKTARTAADCRNDIRYLPYDSVPQAVQCFRTPGEALNHTRNLRLTCPVCGAHAGTGTWIRVSKTEMMTLCSCETDGKFLCSITASKKNVTCSDANPQAGVFTAAPTLYPFEEPQKSRYENARRAARSRRTRKTKEKDPAS